MFSRGIVPVVAAVSLVFASFQAQGDEPSSIRALERRVKALRDAVLNGRGEGVDTAYRKCFHDSMLSKSALEGIEQLYSGKHYFTELTLTTEGFRGSSKELDQHLVRSRSGFQFDRPCGLSKKTSSGSQKLAPSQECCLYTFMKLHQDWQADMERLAAEAELSNQKPDDACLADYRFGRSLTSDCADCNQDEGYACAKQEDSPKETPMTLGRSLEVVRAAKLKERSRLVEYPRHHGCFMMGFVTKRVEYCEGLKSFVTLKASRAIRNEASSGEPPRYVYDRQFCKHVPELKEKGKSVAEPDEKPLRIWTNYDFEKALLNFDRRSFLNTSSLVELVQPASERKEKTASVPERAPAVLEIRRQMGIPAIPAENRSHGERRP